MKPTRTSDIFAGFDPEDYYTTKVNVAKKEDLAGLPGGKVLDAIHARGAEDGLNVIRKVGGLTAIKLGIPDSVVPQIQQLYQLANEISAVDLIRSTGIARQIEGLVTDTLAQVPYLRFVVQVGKLIANLLEYANQRPDVPPDTALSYSPGANENALDVLGYEILDAGDWTSVFMPCQRTPSWSSEEITNVNDMPGFMGKGMRIKAAGALEGSCDGFGLLPGLTEQDGGVYEYPFEMPPNPGGLVLGQGPVIKGPGGTKGGFGWPTTPINTTGSMRPLMRQASAALWQRIMRPSPETFMIDTRYIADAWFDYFESLRAFPSKSPGFDNQGTVQAFSATLAVKTEYRPSEKGLVIRSESRFPGIGFGAGRSGPGRLEVKVRPRVIKSLNENLHDVGGTEYVIYRMVEKLRKMQWYALSRTVVAYVPPSAPALLDNELRDRHEKMRSLLLEHPALCDVDVSLIPDSTYRTAATEAQERLRCFLGPEALTTGQARRAAPPLDTAEEPPGAQGGPPGASENGGGGAVVVAAVLAAALAGVAFL